MAQQVYQLGIEATLKIIGGKWKPIILCHLGYGEVRSGELKKKIPGVSQKVLTEQLKELEADGIISRQVYNEVPPKVIYSLTEEGKTLREVLITMSIWGENRINKAQENGEEVLLINKNHNGFMEM
ncbi:winged helix-turn-helix transcriptional regulator [Vagococcus carniphilus]|uniref:MarR family transcriptional regulator n=1 Tax=Vagococcus carniphilus TaxID=218144 RepID=A0A430B8Z2_9ENTE|nr:helix-turn-helix domain-containing protein [Vagococcus carniphilus]QNN73706.1 helix-turn-helix transcriptional regulator [Vagococcus carniphilus]RSU16769.1 MarR family transcriptional regulator [Vagococcus carniphilus]